jgi:hypothetical protein
MSEEVNNVFGGAEPAAATGEGFGWDTPITVAKRTAQPAGVYHFKIGKFEQCRYKGSDKLPECPSGKVTVVLDNDEAVHAQVWLTPKMMRQVEAFLVCVGEIVPGERKNPAWDMLTGKEGHCELEVQVGDDGDSYNRVKNWVAPNRVVPAKVLTPSAAAADDNPFPF